ncbi:MAG: hypothetical protein CSA95_08900 [Bacteroidetes bacterium]|nr:MAG: hypothetical protein CSA95_08900 [Bacteroidota bacterium]
MEQKKSNSTKICYFATMAITNLIQQTDNLLREIPIAGDLIAGNGADYPRIMFMRSHPHEWTFIILLFLLIGIAISLYHFHRRFYQFIQAFFKYHTLNQLRREGNFMMERLGVTLYTIFLVGISIFTYQAITYFKVFSLPPGHGSVVFLKILVGFLLFFFLKSAIYYLVGWVFNTQKSAYLLILDDYLIKSFNGLILLPILFISTYYPSPTLFYIGLTVLSIIFIYRILRASLINREDSQISLFYLFLYLCSLEVVPVVAIAKTLIGNR